MDQTISVPPTYKMKHDFDRDGYLSIKPLFNAIKVAEINHELDRFIKEVVPNMSSKEVYLEDKSDPTSIKQLMNMNHHDGYIYALAENSVLREIATKVLGEDVIPTNVEYFNKPPGGKATPAHQDGYYFHLTPSKAVTCWVSLEEVDHENGCLHYIRQSHKEKGFREHASSGVLGFSQGLSEFSQDEDKQNTVAHPCQPGTLLMHDSRTIHWAGPNLSKTRSRRALGFIYFAKSAKHDKAASEAYQVKLATELRAANKI